jgi:hypothetical protein
LTDHSEIPPDNNLVWPVPQNVNGGGQEGVDSEVQLPTVDGKTIHSVIFSVSHLSLAARTSPLPSGHAQDKGKLKRSESDHSDS